jgi:hypothetical protein
MSCDDFVTPYCRLLDVPVPDKDFPRENDTASMQLFSKILWAVWIGLPVIGTTAVIGILYLLARLLM